MRTVRNRVLQVLVDYIFICLVLSAWCPKSVATSWPFAYWGKTVNGVQCKIYSTRLVVMPGQKYEIRLMLRNAGNQIQVLDTFPYITNKDWINFRLCGELIGNIHITDQDTLTLKSGQTIDLPLMEDACKRTAKGMRIYGYKAHMAFQNISGRKGYTALTSNRINVMEVPTPVDLTLLAVIVGVIVYRNKMRKS